MFVLGLNGLHLGDICFAFLHLLEEDVGEIAATSVE